MEVLDFHLGHLFTVIQFDCYIKASPPVVFYLICACSRSCYSKRKRRFELFGPIAFNFDSHQVDMLLRLEFIYCCYTLSQVQSRRVEQAKDVGEGGYRLIILHYHKNPDQVQIYLRIVEQMQACYALYVDGA